MKWLQVFMDRMEQRRGRRAWARLSPGEQLLALIEVIRTNPHVRRRFNQALKGR